jgi:hypothetical protein
MAAPDYLGSILATGGRTASVILMLCFGFVAALQLLAGAVAIFTKDPDRAQRCLEVLRILRNRDSPLRILRGKDSRARSVRDRIPHGRPSDHSG